MGKRAILRALITWQAGKRLICIFLHGIRSWIFHLSNKKRIHQVWVNKIFDLRTWTAGMCYTYNPPNKSDTLLTSRFDNNDIHILKEILNEYFQNFLNQTDSLLLLARMALTTQPTHWKVSAKVPNKIVIISLGFDIYLHEKDQFWPRQGPSDHGDKVL